MIAAGTLVRSRVFAVRKEMTAVVVLGTMVVLSAVVRGVIAHWHSAPRYWPDEYIYAGLSRSIASGHLEIRGSAAHFYAILQPTLAAPFWQFFPARTAYRLIQLEGALEASLVVIPLWLLCRELDLGRKVSYLACAFSLVVPTLVMIPVTISDWIAYPLAIASVTAAVRSLNRPTWRRQVVFLSFALLATTARIQCFVIVPAYLFGALLLERRRAPRVHPLVFLALLPAIAGAVLAATGYYGVDSSSFKWSIGTWMALQCFLLALTAGVFIVPGAVAALLRPIGRVETAFASVVGVFILLTLAEASQAAAAEGRYKERYLLAIVPLLAVAFGVHLRHARTHRIIALAVGAALIVTAARLPLDAYTHNAPFYDSQTLNVLWLTERHVSASTSSILVAAFITLAAVVGIVGAMRPRIALVALPLSILCVIGITAVATHIDIVNNAAIADPTWIDEAAHGAPVTAVSTPASGKIKLLKQLYWNKSLKHEVVLESAYATDSYATTQIKPGPDGELPGVHGYFLFDRTGTQAEITGAKPIATNASFTLYRGEHPRFRILVENQLSTAWLSPFARLRAWPNGKAVGTPVVHFTLTLPPTPTRRVHIHLGTQTFVVKTGVDLRFTCRSNHWPFKLLLVSQDAVPDYLGRPVTVGMTHVTATGSPTPFKGAASCTASR